MAIIGLKNLHYAVMTQEDTATTPAVYDKPKRLVGLISVDIAPENETKKLYGDNTALASFTATKSRAIKLEVADLPLEDEAAILGHTYTGGKMIVKGNDTPPYVALMFDADTHDGKTQYTVFYKGKFAEAQHTDNTRGESMDFTPFNLEGEFVARVNDDQVYAKCVTTDPAVADSWYASVDGETGGGSGDTGGNTGGTDNP